MGVGASRHEHFTPGKETRYPLYRRLCGIQSRSRRVRKITHPPGFDSRTVKLVASSYTAWAIPAHTMLMLMVYIINGTATPWYHFTLQYVAFSVNSILLFNWKPGRARSNHLHWCATFNDVKGNVSAKIAVQIGLSSPVEIIAYLSAIHGSQFARPVYRVIKMHSPFV